MNPLLIAVIALCLGVGCSAAETADSTSSAADSAGTDTAETDTGEASDVGLEFDGGDEGSAEITEPTSGDPCLHAGTAGATATCLKPNRPPEYYVEQANKYFDTLDIDADPESIPNYAEGVARWEWPPWLLLTGLGRQDMIDTAKILREFDPSTVPERDCRFFETQPFARCLVRFEYEEGPCPIYEEFVFNEKGEMTFIEAWSDLPGLRPQTDPNDPWGEMGTLRRLGTVVPGLGTDASALDLESPWMTEAAAADADIADLVTRAGDWWMFWFEALTNAENDFFAKGCGWPSH